MSLSHSRRAPKDRNIETNEEIVELNGVDIVDEEEVRVAFVVSLGAKDVAKAETTFWITSTESILKEWVGWGTESTVLLASISTI